MMITFSESGHPGFRGSSALERGPLRSKGQLSIHVCVDPQTVEVVFSHYLSVNQLSIYGAVADMCEELASRLSDCSASTERLVAKDKPTDLSTTADPLMTNDQAREDLLREYKQRFADLPDDLRLIRLCSAGFMKRIEQIRKGNVKRNTRRPQR